MRHGCRVKKLGRKKAHRKSLLRNLLRALFDTEKIKTTLSKAKELKREADRLIARAQEDTLANRRLVQQRIGDKGLVKKLFTEIAPRFKEKIGGYCRIIRCGFRPGDNAEMAIIELIVKREVKEKKK